jgi:hypothetical protein
MRAGRSALVGALLADPHTRVELARIATLRGVAPGAVARLANTDLSLLAAGSTAAQTAPAASPTPPESSPVETMDWKTGITFPVTTAPTYSMGGNNWVVGFYSIDSVEMWGTLHDWMGWGVVNVDPRPKAYITLDVELPRCALHLHGHVSSWRLS